MEILLHMTGFEMKHGDSVEVEGRIKSSTVRFIIELGTDPANKSMHFNPRFSKDSFKIILNNMVNSIWKEEQIEESLLRINEDFTVLIMFNKDNFEIVVSNKTILKFPNRSGTDILKAFWIRGDVHVKSVKYNIQAN